MDMDMINGYLTVLSCSKLLYTFSYLLNSVEAKDVKLCIKMRLEIRFVFHIIYEFQRLISEANFRS